MSIVAGPAAGKPMACAQAGSHRCSGWVWGESLVSPRSAARRIADRPDEGLGRTAVAGFAVAYSVAALTSFLTGRLPQRPMLRFVRPERYYLWETFFVAPVAFAWMRLFTTLAHRVAHRWGGHGGREAVTTVLAVDHTAPLIVAMWLPDMACYLLRLDEQRYRRLVAVYAPAATAWALVLCTLGLSEAEQISRRKAAAAILLADTVGALASGVPFAMR